jgi:hypothetical protein
MAALMQRSVSQPSFYNNPPLSLDIPKVISGDVMVKSDRSFYNNDYSRTPQRVRAPRSHIAAASLRPEFDKKNISFEVRSLTPEMASSNVDTTFLTATDSISFPTTIDSLTLKKSSNETIEEVTVKNKLLVQQLLQVTNHNTLLANLLRDQKNGYSAQYANLGNAIALTEGEMSRYKANYLNLVEAHAGCKDQSLEITRLKQILQERDHESWTHKNQIQRLQMQLADYKHVNVRLNNALVDLKQKRFSAKVSLTKDVEDSNLTYEVQLNVNDLTRELGNLLLCIINNLYLHHPYRLYNSQSPS